MKRQKKKKEKEEKGDNGVQLYNRNSKCRLSFLVYLCLVISTKSDKFTRQLAINFYGEHNSGGIAHIIARCVVIVSSTTEYRCFIIQIYGMTTFNHVTYLYISLSLSLPLFFSFTVPPKQPLNIILRMLSSLPIPYSNSLNIYICLSLSFSFFSLNFLHSERDRAERVERFTVKCRFSSSRSRTSFSRRTKRLSVTLKKCFWHASLLSGTRGHSKRISLD